MKYFLIFFFVFNLIGCATEEQKIKEKALNEVFISTAYANSSAMICNQEAYQECFELSEDECRTLIDPHSTSCVDSAYSFVNEDIVNNSKKFSYHFVNCLVENLYEETSADKEVTNDCLNKIPIDKGLIIKTLMR